MLPLAGRRRASVSRVGVIADTLSAGLDVAVWAALRVPGTPEIGPITASAAPTTRPQIARARQVRGARLALERSLRATEQRVAAGLDSRQSLEEARRAVIDIRINELATVREGLIAGVSLYRAAGGGWNTP